MRQVHSLQLLAGFQQVEDFADFGMFNLEECQLSEVGQVAQNENGFGDLHRLLVLFVKDLDHAGQFIDRCCYHSGRCCHLMFLYLIFLWFGGHLFECVSSFQHG